MGDSGGRRLVFNLYGVDSTDIQDYQALPIRGMLPNYTWSDAPNFERGFADPLKEAKCLPLGRRDTFNGSAPPRQRYSGTHKPAFVSADILPRHLAQGESTTACVKLRDIILQRGLSNDDCGHIIAKQFGGKMIDYNLFPQCKEINRGYGIWSRIWKWGAELLVRVWLISQADCDPMVRVRIWLLYSNPNSSVRPHGLLFHHEYYKKDKGKEKAGGKDKEANEKALRYFIRAAIFGEVPNECKNIDAEAAKNSMRGFCGHLKKLKEMSHLREVESLIKILIEEIERSLNPPKITRPDAPTPMSSNKPFSWWDIVPIVGTVRTFDDAVRCADRGDTVGALTNTAFGMASGILDVVTLGTVGTVSKAVSASVKEGAKIGTKAAAKQVSIIAIEKAVQVAAQEAVENLAVTAVTQLARGAIRGIALLQA